jgi:hypothetical protein
VLATVPGSALASDQAYRIADLAIDFCEDVPPLPETEVDRIVAVFERAGAQAKVSSIHVNGWFGDYNKLSMAKTLLADVFGIGWDEARESVIYAGDSPNDEPMFAAFPLERRRRQHPGLRAPPEEQAGLYHAGSFGRGLCRIGSPAAGREKRDSAR